MTTDSHTCCIRLGKADDLSHLTAIELAAAVTLADHVPPSILQESTDLDELQEAVKDSRLWVATVGDLPVGFALIDFYDDDIPHLQEMDVHPDFQRRGIGAQLLNIVIDWFESSPYQSMTLTTFRAIPWNAPFYARHGFTPITRDELSDSLCEILQDEAQRGLDPAERIAMRRQNMSKKGSR